MVMEDNKSCGSRVVESSSGKNRHQRKKADVYNEVLRRLKEADHPEVREQSFDDQLWTHFNYLPARYAMDVNVERAEDVLTHKRLLHLTCDPVNSPPFEVCLVQVLHSEEANRKVKMWTSPLMEDSHKQSNVLEFKDGTILNPQPQAMFLGIRSKHKKDPSVRVTYTIHIMEIRPWPPSDSLRSLQTVLLQWESGNHHSGTFLSTAVDSKIVFNESFKLPLVLHQDKKDQDKFHRNNLDFTLFSPHNNKSRGQLLATAVLNLADYGVIEHVVSLGALVNFKKGVGSSYNSIQPVLIVLVEPVEMGSCSLSKELEPSLDGLGMAYFTDDDDDVDSPNYEAEPSSLSSRIHKIYERSMTSIKKKPDNPYVRSYSLSSRHQPDTFAALSEEVIWNRSHEVISDSKHIVTENPQQAIENKAPVDIKEAISEPSENEVEWERRIEMLEEELRETAAIEIGLYSVVAEHASSVNKVHVAARRLSRFYSDACKSGSKAKRASAARATVCGLVVVSKSCGNDVARLTFWLSNSIMLRTTVIQIASESSNEFDDVSTFITALENIESWLFSRIIESVWWQTFTPHMHPAVTEEIDVAPVLSTKKTYSRSNSLIYHGQGIFSTELWKKAFKDACESLCPIRADGHECGCLILLVRMLMVQLVDRLDTAMFNAILRESAEEMPTDPLSDPITESKVLPILAGKSSFGAGVELKNSIGTWSRCLTDIFGLEDETRENTKVFRLLHALSDLMMLPFEMLADVSTIREVCPMLGPSVVKRILSTYVPDEFCPDSIPQSLIEALDNEEVSVIGEESGVVVSFPCAASPARYSPPCAALVGDVGSEMVQRSSLLKKSYTSDDELDELDSPFTSIIPESFRSPALAKLSSAAREEGGKRVVRYQLLREIWRDDE